MKYLYTTSGHLCIVVFVLFCTTCVLTAPPLFTNPLPSNDNASYQDPWVVAAGGSYYYCGSAGGSIFLTKSSGLPTLLTQQKHIIFTPPNGTMYSANLWAPELHHRYRRWYVYFAADDGVHANHRMHVLEGGQNSSDPLQGEYVYKAKLAAAIDTFAIDGHPFDFKSEAYFVWSGWETMEDASQNLYIAKMSNPYTIEGERVEISRPEFDWEKKGQPINEGPTSLISGSTVNIIYSGSVTYLNDYCLGLITCRDGNLMSKSCWTKTGPVFSKIGNVFAPGHASFTKSPDDIQWWIVFHAAYFDGSGFDRRIMTQQFTWDGDVPYFGYPVVKGAPMPYPSTNPEEAMPLADGVYKIKSKVTSQCVDVPGGENQPGLQIQQWPDNGASAQKWRFSKLGNGYYKITSIASGLNLDNTGGSPQPGNIFIQWLDNGNIAQHWRVQDMRNGYFKLINRRSLLALDVPSGNKTPGTKLQQWFENPYEAELWQIIP